MSRTSNDSTWRFHIMLHIEVPYLYLSFSKNARYNGITSSHGIHPNTNQIQVQYLFVSCNNARITTRVRNFPTASASKEEQKTLVALHSMFCFITSTFTYAYTLDIVGRIVVILSFQHSIGSGCLIQYSLSFNCPFSQKDDYPLESIFQANAVTIVSDQSYLLAKSNSFGYCGDGGESVQSGQYVQCAIT